MSRALARALALVVAGCGPSATTAAPRVDARPDAPRPPAPTARLSTVDVIMTQERPLCLRRDGGVVCKVSRSHPAVPLVGFEGAVSIAGSQAFTCGAYEDGKVRCAGANERGQIGARSRAERLDVLTEVQGVAGARLVAVGSTHACAATSSQVVCWGANDRGETGGETAYDADAREVVVPARVADLGAVKKLALGQNASCAITEADELRCWGVLLAEPYGTSRRRGEDGRPGSTTPVAVSGVARAFDVSLVGSTACAATGEDVVCFGDTAVHAVRQTGAATPLGVPGARKVAITWSYGCALDGEGATWCWGSRASNPRYFASRVSGPPATDPPERVPDVPAATDVFVSDDAACVVTRDQELYCWGRFPWFVDEAVLSKPTRIDLAVRP